jgi:hypothetical protein
MQEINPITNKISDLPSHPIPVGRVDPLAFLLLADYCL